MRRAQNADTHALKQPRLSQNISPVCSSFVLVIASDIHLESEREKRAKNVDLHTAKNIQIQPTFFSRYFLQNDLRPIYCSRTTARQRERRITKVTNTTVGDSCGHRSRTAQWSQTEEYARCETSAEWLPRRVITLHSTPYQYKFEKKE